MTNATRRAAATSLFAALVLASCGGAAGPRTVRPGAPGEPTRPVPAGETVPRPGLARSEADLAFVRAMLGHHAQALEMTALVPSRTSSDDIRLLAQRIEVSQGDEIATMERWLAAQGEETPGPEAHAHHGAGHHAMPGMLTPDEMSRLAAASGPEFDRLFLELMIRHHEGALVMVEDLFASPGGGQAGDIFQIASEVASDQRIEIDRMRALLAARRP